MLKIDTIATILILFVIDVMTRIFGHCVQHENNLVCREIHSTAELAEYATKSNLSHLIVLNSELDVTIISFKTVAFVEMYGCTVYKENRSEANFAGLPKLQHLIIAHNKIKNLTTFSFYGNPELKILNLSYNKLKRIPMIKSDSLKQLDLSGNELTSLDMNHFVHLPKLELLVIEHNCFYDVHRNVHAVLKNAMDPNCSTHVEEDEEDSCFRIGRICMEPRFSAEVSSNATPADASNFEVGDSKNATNSSTHEEDDIIIDIPGDLADNSANETNSDQYRDKMFESQVKNHETETDTVKSSTTENYGGVSDSFSLKRTNTTALESYKYTGAVNPVLYATIAFLLCFLITLALIGTFILFKIQSKSLVAKDEQRKTLLRVCKALPQQLNIDVGDLSDNERYSLPVSMPGDNLMKP